VDAVVGVVKARDEEFVWGGRGDIEEYRCCEGFVENYKDFVRA
jgi:hypothetical protein